MGAPALAACVTSGSVTNCTTATPNPYATTVGTGRLDNDRTVNVASGASIQVTNRNAISLGDNARINLAAGSLVRTDATSGSGLYGTGPQPIEFNSNGILVVGEGAQVISRGTQAQAEAVNVHGFGNRIENHGLISGQASAAIWFEDQLTGAKNVVDNFGTIEQINGATVIGTSGGSGIDFYNHTGAVVDGSLQFAGGDDALYFYAGSTVTGAINGGAGNNSLLLEGDAGTSDTLAGALANFQTLTKQGLGRWTITGTLSGFQSTTVNLGTLALTGDNVGYGAGVLINPLGTLEARAQSLPTQVDPADNVDNIRNNGRLRFAQDDTGTYVGQIVGSGVVQKVGAGVTTLAPTAADGNTYAGGTEIDAGTLAVAASSALGAAAGGLSFDGGTLRTTETFTMARTALLEDGGGTFEPTAGTTLTETGVVSGVGRLTKIGAGTLALDAANTYAGGTQIDAGTVEVSSDANLGGAAGTLGIDDGTLRTTASFATARATTLGPAGGTFETEAGTLTHTGAIGGTGALTKTGSGTLGLDGANTYAGGTLIDAGIIDIDADANLGAAAGTLGFDGGTLRSNATLAMDRTTTMAAGGGVFDTVAGTVLTQAGAIGGAGAMTKAGAGTLVLTGDAAHTGGTTIAAGRLQIGDGGTTGSLAGSVVDNGVLAFDRSDALDVDGAIGGTGALVQAGSGVTRLNGDNFYSGTTTVAGGALYVNGNQAGATGVTTAQAGTTLGGAGLIGGDVTIADGATLAPGDVGAAPGTLSIAGGLALSGGARLAYSFGAANVVGGALNDLTEVAGDLVLDGTIDVTTPPDGSFDTGIYRVISYGGALTDNGLAVGTIPAAGYFVQTSTANQVNLVNTSGLTLTFWDGAAGPKNDGVVDGGDGTWQTSVGNDNWTEATGTINAPWTDAGFAIFSAAAGTVTVDGSLGGVRAAGMQFATDGYRVIGDSVALVGTDAVIRVGDGTTAGAGMTATVASALTGSARLVKTDAGTLVLSGTNTYGGGTAIDGGVLEVARDASLGAAAGGLGLDGGTLRASASFAMDRDAVLGAGGGSFETGDGVTLSQAGDVAGTGALTKAGAGTVVLSGDSSHTGGTTIAAGTLQVGNGGTAGTLAGDVVDNGTLVFDRSDAVAFGGAISGSGDVRQAGDGTTTFSGANTYTGVTAVTGGTLAAGAAGAFAAGSAHAVAAAGTLDLDGFDQRVARLVNAGRVTLGQVPGTGLTVTGDYVGQGGVLHFTSALGGDASVTDLLTVAGDTSGTGVVEVTNGGGFGGQTVNGLKLIDVAGASDAAFTLAGDTVFGGRPVVIAGAYAYSLWQGGVASPGDGDWYLRSQSTIQPGAPQVQPGVPTYEGYPQTLLALNGLPTMQERVGNRYWTGAGASPGFGGVAADGVTSLPSGGLSENRRTWMRVEGSRVRLSPDGALIGTPDYDMDVWKLQVGMDGQVHETDDAVVVGGITFTTGAVSTDVSSDAGNGSIDTDGYGLGGTLTWLRDDDFYVDGQAQAMWYNSDLSTDTSGKVANGNDGFGYALGVEVGRRVAWKEDWTVTPQAQLVYSSVDFDSFSDPFDTRVQSDDGATMPLRVGLALDQEKAWTATGEGDARRTHFYGIANLYYDFMDQTAVNVGGTGLSTEIDQFWGSVGMGGTYSWADGAYSVYGEGLVRTSLEDFGDSYANTATLGFRMAW